MITAKTIEELESLLEKAKEKAMKLDPEIHVVEIGLYQVAGSKGNFYEVRAGRNANGELFIACLCRGALEGKACYHAFVAFCKHVYLKTAELKVDIPNTPYLRKSSERLPEKVGKYRV